MVESPGEQPRPEPCRSTVAWVRLGPFSPGGDARPPRLCDGGAEGEPTEPSALRRPDHLVRGRTADRQDVSIQVVDLQRGPFTPPNTGVRGQPRQEQDLLTSVDLRHLQDPADRIDRRVHPRRRRRWPAHATRRRRVQDAFPGRPAERRAQTPDPGGRGRRADPDGGPAVHRSAQDRGGVLRGPPRPEGISAQRSDRRPVPDDGRRAPAMRYQRRYRRPRQSRGGLVAVDGPAVMVEKGPKSDSGRRTLPVPSPVVAALRAFKAQQAAERLTAGPDAYEVTGYVLVDELGAPQRTEWLRRRFVKLSAGAGLRKVRFYDTRHAALTHMAREGVPERIIAAWAGHRDGGALAKKIYIRPNHADLEMGREAFGGLFSS